ncbi:MAG: CAP domain-containing protein [Clostridia bacterium]|nr:CAP domain-containing protein [Clostridia bacterium]
MKKKGIAALLALAVLGVAGLMTLSSEEPVLLENDLLQAGEILLEDDFVPLSDLPAEGEEQPLDPYEGLDETQKELVDKVVELVNKARAEEGLEPVTLDPALRKAAQIRAKECVGTFSHTRPDGTVCSTVLQEVGIPRTYFGENVATGHKTAELVVERWLASEGHRANILNPAFTRMGVGMEKNVGNRYQGYAWAQLFIQ